MRLDDDVELIIINDGADLLVEGHFETDGVDVAEYYPTLDSRQLTRGTVVALDLAHGEHVVAARGDATDVVLGIVSTAPGLLLGGQMQGSRPDLLAASDKALRAG